MNLNPVIYLLFASALFANSGLACANQNDDLSDLTPEERAFLENDSFFKAMAVNEGELTWVAPEKTDNQYALFNKLILNDESLKTGRVEFEQCHTNLDEISAIDIVYNAKTTQSLELLSKSKIQRVAILPAKAELYGVQKGAEVCLKGTLNLLAKTATGRWQLPRGPYMRKFLDGYYPMHVQESLSWQNTPLEWQGIAFANADKSLPAGQNFQQTQSSALAQKEKSEDLEKRLEKQPQKPSENPSKTFSETAPQLTWHAPQKLQIDYWFEGKLMPIYFFLQKNP